MNSDYPYVHPRAFHDKCCNPVVDPQKMSEEGYSPNPYGVVLQVDALEEIELNYNYGSSHR